MQSLSLYQSETKRSLLLLMKHRGAISLDDAESATGLARTTLREHLGGLENDGLVQRTTNRYGRGRPSLLYTLTKDAKLLFPARDHELLGALLDYLEGLERTDLVDAFFVSYWTARAEDAKRLCAKLDDDDQLGRARVLERLLTEQGFMPRISDDGNRVVVRECNCPFPEAVKRTRLPCKLEAKFIADVLRAPLDRVSYIPDGAPACTYEVGTPETVEPDPTVPVPTAPAPTAPSSAAQSDCAHSDCA